MKIPAVVLFIVCVLSCNNEVEVNNNKDLEQNMMDLKIYQENLGDEIKSKDLENASWLLEGMDSILLILNKKFQEHRKLSDPFSYFYRKRLQSPIKGIRNAIKKNDTAKAMENYRLLVKRCNDCHADNDIDKVVKF
jgi:hypothetical protein